MKMSIEPYISAKESQISAKEPTCISAQKCCIFAKEPNISAIVLYMRTSHEFYNKGSLKQYEMGIQYERDIYRNIMMCMIYIHMDTE